MTKAEKLLNSMEVLHALAFTAKVYRNQGFFIKYQKYKSVLNQIVDLSATKIEENDQIVDLRARVARLRGELDACQNKNINLTNDVLRLGREKQKK